MAEKPNKSTNGFVPVFNCEISGAQLISKSININADYTSEADTCDISISISTKERTSCD